MVEKFGDKDAKNGNFNNQMGFRKKSNVVAYCFYSYCVVYLASFFFGHSMGISVASIKITSKKLSSLSNTFFLNALEGKSLMYSYFCLNIPMKARNGLAKI